MEVLPLARTTLRTQRTTALMLRPLAHHGPRGRAARAGGLSQRPYGHDVGRRPAPATLDPERHACTCMVVCYTVYTPIAIIFSWITS